MPCLADLTFEFIRRPIPPILSPSSRKIVELTLVTPSHYGLSISLEPTSYRDAERYPEW
jgi:hypothetical protein